MSQAVSGSNLINDILARKQRAETDSEKMKRLAQVVTHDGPTIGPYDPTTEAATSRLGNAFFKSTMATYAPGLTNVILRGIGKTPEEANDIVYGDMNTSGVAGQIGGAVGSGAFMIPAALGSGPVAGTAGVFSLVSAMSVSAKEEFDRSGDAMSAVGIGVIELISEKIGGAALGAIGKDTAKSIGESIAKKQFGDAYKLAGNLGMAATTNVTEEEFALVAGEFWKSTVGTQTFEEAVNNIENNYAQTAVNALIAGPVTMAGSASLRVAGAQINSNDALFPQTKQFIKDLTKLEQDRAIVSTLNIAAQKEIDSPRSIYTTSWGQYGGLQDNLHDTQGTQELKQIVSATEKVPTQQKYDEVLNEYVPIEEAEQVTTTNEEQAELEKNIENKSREKEALRSIVEGYNQGTISSADAFEQSLAIATNTQDAQNYSESLALTFRFEDDALSANRTSSKTVLNSLLKTLESDSEVAQLLGTDENLKDMSAEEIDAYAEKISGNVPLKTVDQLIQLSRLKRLAKESQGELANEKARAIEKELVYQMFKDKNLNDLQKQLDLMNTELKDNVRIVLDRPDHSVSTRPEGDTVIITYQNQLTGGISDTEYVFKDSISSAIGMKLMERGESVPKDLFERGTRYGHAQLKSVELAEAGADPAAIAEAKKAEKKEGKPTVLDRGPIELHFNPLHNEENILTDILGDIKKEVETSDDLDIEDIKTKLFHFLPLGVKNEVELQTFAENLIADATSKTSLLSAISKIGSKKFRVKSLDKKNRDDLSAILSKYSSTDGKGGIGFVNSGRIIDDEAKAFADKIFSIVDFSSNHHRKKASVRNKAAQKLVDKHGDAVPQDRQDVINESERLHFADLDTAQVIGFLNAFKQVEAINDRVIKEKKAEQEGIRKENSLKVSTEMGAAGMPLSNKRVKGARPNKNVLIQFKDIISSTIENARLETLIKNLAGTNNEKSSKVFYDDLRVAVNSWEKQWSTLEQQFADKLNSLGLTPDDIALASDHKSIRTNPKFLSLSSFSAVARQGRGLTTSEKINFNFENAGEIELTRGEMLHLLALIEDPETFDMMFVNEEKVPIVLKDGLSDSVQVTMNDIVAIRELLGDKYLGVIDAMKDSLVETSRQMGEWSKETHFENIAVRKHHVPRQRRDVEKGRTEENPLDILDSKDSLQTLNITLGRGDDTTSPIILDDIFAFHHRYIRQVTGLAHVAPFIRNAKDVMRSPEFSNLIRTAKKGTDLKARLNAQMKELVRDITARREDEGVTARFVNQVAENLTRSLIGINPQVVAYQPASIIAASSEIPWRHIVKNMTAFTQGGEGSQLNKDIRGNAFLGSRDAGHGLAFVDETNRTDISNEDPAYWGVRTADRATIRIIVAAAKDYAAELNASGNGAQVSWEHIAEMAVRRTQPGGGTLEMTMPALKARSTPGWRLLNMFRSQRSKNADMLYTALNDLRDDEKSKFALFSRLFMLLFGQAMWIESVRQIFDAGERTLIGEDDEMEIKEAFLDFNFDLASSVIGNFYQADIPSSLLIGAGRTLAGSGRNQVFAPNVSPAASMLEGVAMNVFKASSAINRGEPISPAMAESLTGFTKHIMNLYGMPTNYIMGLLEDYVGTFDEPKKKSKSRNVRL